MSLLYNYITARFSIVDLGRLSNLGYGSFVIFVNRVGSEAGLTFWGGSRILNPTGKVLAEAPLYKEAIIVGDLDASLIRNARKYRPYHRDEDPRFARRQLEKIIHEYEY